MWCFPKTEGAVSDQLIVTVDDNPECVVVPLHALGAVPAVEVSPTSLDFERLMLGQADTRELTVKNTSAVPVYWKIANKKATPDSADGTVEQDPDTLPPQFSIEPTEGILIPGASQNLVVLFRASKANLYNFALRIAVQDTEGYANSGLAKAEQDHPTDAELKIKHEPPELLGVGVDVAGECFEVDVGVEFPGEQVGLDFGSLRVGESKEQTFEIVNHGKYPLKYDLKIKKKAVLEILSIKDEVGRDQDIQPGERRPMRVEVVSFKQVKFENTPDLHLRIFEAKSGERVEPAIPAVRLTVSAGYNMFTVTPPRGLNFGPVRSGAEPKTRTFEIRNDGVFAFDWALVDLSQIMADPNIKATPPPREPPSPGNKGSSPGGGRDNADYLSIRGGKGQSCLQKIIRTTRSTHRTTTQHPQHRSCSTGTTQHSSTTGRTGTGRGLMDDRTVFHGFSRELFR